MDNNKGYFIAHLPDFRKINQLIQRELANPPSQDLLRPGDLILLATLLDDLPEMLQPTEKREGGK